MVSWKLIVYCIAAAGVWLFVASLLLDLIARALRLASSVPADLVEKTSPALTLANFVMELIFYVGIPTMAYSFFYFLIPLSGVRAGMAAALMAFGLGAVPTVMSISLRLRLPAPYLLYVLLSVLIKLGGSLSIIAYLYSL